MSRRRTRRSFPGHAGQLLPQEADLPFVCGIETQQGPAQRGLATAALADETERFVAVNPEADAVDGRDARPGAPLDQVRKAAPLAERHLEIAYFEHRMCHLDRRHRSNSLMASRVEACGQASIVDGAKCYGSGGAVGGRKPATLGEGAAGAALGQLRWLPRDRNEPALGAGEAGNRGQQAEGIGMQRRFE